MKCSHISCRNESVETVEITETDVVAERNKKTTKVNPFGIVPTPGTWYYCPKHVVQIKENPLLEYIWSKFKDVSGGI